MVSALPFCQWTQLLHDTFWEVGGGRVLCDGFLVYRCLQYPLRSFCHADYTLCPTRYRTRHFFNNFTTNDIATKFEMDLPHCVRNVTTS